MTVKIDHLTPNNVQAIRETLPSEWVETTATTATFEGEAPSLVVRGVIAGLPDRGHPRASLYAVLRKLEAQ